MSEEIKIIWIDDDLDAFDVLMREITAYYYKKEGITIEITGIDKSSNLKDEVLIDSDLVLADYNLDTTEETGVDVIKKIRNSLCVADIILYSDNQDITKLKRLREQLGHYAVAKIIYKRVNLKEEVYREIERMLSGFKDFVILRGLIIGETIDAELKVNEFLLRYYGVKNQKAIEFNNQLLENPYFSLGTKTNCIDQIRRDITDTEFKSKLKKIVSNMQNIMKIRNKFAHCKEENDHLIEFGCKPIDISRSTIKSNRKLIKETTLLINEVIRDHIQES